MKLEIMFNKKRSYSSVKHYSDNLLIQVLKKRLKNRLIIADLTPYIYWLTKKQKNFIIKSRKKRN